MADSRIKDLPLAEEITNNDFFVFDGSNSGTKKIAKGTLFENIENAIEGIESNVTDIESEIGDTVLPTTAQTLSGAIAEHESDISTLNSNLDNLIKYKDIAVSITTSDTGRTKVISTSLPDGYTAINVGFIYSNDLYYYLTTDGVNPLLTLRADNNISMVGVNKALTPTTARSLVIRVAYIKSN